MSVDLLVNFLYSDDGAGDDPVPDPDPVDPVDPDDPTDPDKPPKPDPPLPEPSDLLAKCSSWVDEIT